ncbi:hypothetical protein [Amycolatopsis rubida]|uniref:YbaB/EbfC DNA-binding family protein n=1 Tax=Amycolatopsis rubida TaxID=112413 RepID=A0A1I5L7Z4_9PSEU|nr:hypothetical protein [Amycolatopsis rubida]SFO92861.1 hypothetical protein SAMN05421854_103465 [Amycolatopsis rubida]
MTDPVASANTLDAGLEALRDIGARLDRAPAPQPPPTVAEPVLVGTGKARGFRAADRTGVVTITLDEDLKLVEATVLDHWKSRVEPAFLGEALTEAYLAALDAAVQERSERLASETPPAAAPASDADGPVVFPTLDEVVAAARASRERNENERLRQQRERGPAAEPEPPHEVSGSFGYLTLRVQGGAMLSASPNVSALANAGTANLQEDIEAAFGNAGLKSPHAVSESGSVRRDKSAGREFDEEEDAWRGFHGND